jgi:uncharacterized protein
VPATPDHVRIELSGVQACPSVGALVWGGETPDRAAVVLAHGAGTDMHHAHLQRHAADLVAAGHPTALFNFPFTEIGRRRPDPAARLLSTWRDVIEQLGPRLGEARPLVIGGRSMGGRMATMIAADASGPDVAGVVAIAYPLHPPGRPDRLRVEHWPGLRAPVLLVSGSRDAMAPIPAVQRNLAVHMPAGRASLHVVAGADHSFRVRKMDGRSEDEVLADVGSAVTSWLAAIG